MDIGVGLVMECLFFSVFIVSLSYGICVSSVVWVYVDGMWEMIECSFGLFGVWFGEVSLVLLLGWFLVIGYVIVMLFGLIEGVVYLV